MDFFVWDREVNIESSISLFIWKDFVGIPRLNLLSQQGVSLI